MTTYRFTATPTPMTALFSSGLPTLEVSELTSAIAGAVLRSISGTDPSYDVELEIPPRSREEAVQQIATAVETLGFRVAEMTITEWANKAAQGFVAGLLGGGGFGSTSNEVGVTACLRSPVDCSGCSSDRNCEVSKPSTWRNAAIRTPGS